MKRKLDKLSYQRGIITLYAWIGFTFIFLPLNFGQIILELGISTLIAIFLIIVGEFL
jgi:hypothetical protein